MIERHIDYLQFSALFSEQIIIEKRWESVPSPRFYQRGYKDEWGFRYYFGNPNSKKCLVVGSGSALEFLRDNGRLDAQILQWALESDAVFSRLDLAITDYIEDEFVTVGDVQKWYEKGLITSSLCNGGAKLISGYHNSDLPSVETFYIGSMAKRGKRGIFRAYDKSLDLGIGNEIITRLELEERGEKAHNTALRIAETNDIAGNFRARFDVASSDFDRLMDADAVSIHRGIGREKREDEEKMNGRWAWLMEQVAPALKEAQEYDKKHHPESKRFYWFLRESGMTHEQIKRMVDEIRKEWEDSQQ